ncbi:MAG: sulfatase/phosphatase domain-containing protein, partial [Bryobacteraceae bacterium]
RGHKRHLWDGGHHVPFLMRWPVRIKSGSVSNEIVCLTDFMATSAAIAGVTLPASAGEDSCSILPAFAGGNLAKPIREAVVHHSSSGAFAIRQGEWKLILLRGSGDGAPSKAESLPPGQLYNLAQDVAEEKNLYNDRPEIVRRLTALLERYKTEGRSAPLIAAAKPLRRSPR